MSGFDISGRYDGYRPPWAAGLMRTDLPALQPLEQAGLWLCSIDYPARVRSAVSTSQQKQWRRASRIIIRLARRWRFESNASASPF